MLIFPSKSSRKSLRLDEVQGVGEERPEVYYGYIEDVPQPGDKAIRQEHRQGLDSV